MKKLIFLFFTIFHLQASELDQPIVIFGASGYVLYRVLDFANDHGFRFMKILSYDFHSFGHHISGSCSADNAKGRYFELKDEHALICFLCLDKPPPNDPYVIDLEKYRFLLKREE